MKLTKLLSMLMYEVDTIEFYNKNMTFMYDLKASEISEQCEDRVSKFNIYNRENERILEIIVK